MQSAHVSVPGSRGPCRAQRCVIASQPDRLPFQRKKPTRRHVSTRPHPRAHKIRRLPRREQFHVSARPPSTTSASTVARGRHTGLTLTHACAAQKRRARLNRARSSRIRVVRHSRSHADPSTNATARRPPIDGLGAKAHRNPSARPARTLPAARARRRAAQPVPSAASVSPRARLKLPVFRTKVRRARMSFAAHADKRRPASSRQPTARHSPAESKISSRCLNTARTISVRGALNSAAAYPVHAAASVSS